MVAAARVEGRGSRPRATRKSRAKPQPRTRVGTGHAPQSQSTKVETYARIGPVGLALDSSAGNRSWSTARGRHASSSCHGRMVQTRPEHRFGSVMTLELPECPWAMRHRPATTHSWARSPVAAGQARRQAPGARHEPVVTPAWRAGRPSRGVDAIACLGCLLCSRVDPRRVRGPCRSRCGLLAAAIPPPSSTYPTLPGPPWALLMTVASLRSGLWGSNHSLSDPCSQLTNPAGAIFETRSHFSRCYPAGHARIRPLISKSSIQSHT